MSGPLDRIARPCECSYFVNSFVTSLWCYDLVWVISFNFIFWFSFLGIGFLFWQLKEKKKKKER